MRIRSFVTSRSFFRPGEKVSFTLELEASAPETGELRLIIQHLADPVMELRQPLSLPEGISRVELPWLPPARLAGYGARAELWAADRLESGKALCFDVLGDWTDFPRYGYLTDFSQNRPDPQATLAGLARYHINGLQFYDWQYRHDQLVAPTTSYIDPLGRGMSLETVRSLVETAGNFGMAAMPYLAVYAASAAFWREHPESALYDKDGQPIPFGEDFLGLMNPAAGSPWREHLLAECANALRAIPFVGLHIDQYGEPRQVWDARGAAVDLPEAFAGFIGAARANHPAEAIVFNAVGNWPVETLAACPLDFMYIEIWPPDTRYRDVARIVMDAVRLSGGKAVVIALYLPASHPENVVQLDALILACGGTRIELGEETRLLADPYFPKHQEISLELKTELLQFYDFMAQYGEWLQSYALSSDERSDWAEGELNPSFVQVDEQVWSVVRRHPGGLAITLVNFNGLDRDLGWDTPHPAPAALANLSVRLKLPWNASTIYYVSPEQAGRPPISLDFELRDGQTQIMIPNLQVLGVLFIHE